MSKRRLQAIGLVMLAAGALTACRGSGGDSVPSAPPATSESPASAPATERLVGPLTPADAQALATMTDPLKRYVDLHLKLERSLPALPQDATPQQIDTHQRALQTLMQQARGAAKPGEIFTLEAQPVIKRLLDTVFGGPDGKELKASIMDENPVDPVALKVTVNSRYPDSVPLTTIPPQVLQTLPELAEDLEYRVLGDWLILLDAHSHTVADFIEDALPK